MSVTKPFGERGDVLLYLGVGDNARAETAREREGRGVPHPRENPAFARPLVDPLDDPLRVVPVDDGRRVIPPVGAPPQEELEREFGEVDTSDPFHDVRPEALSLFGVTGQVPVGRGAWHTLYQTIVWQSRGPNDCE